MDNADLDSIIGAVAAVITAYVEESHRTGSNVQKTWTVFDEADQPLDDSGCWESTPEPSVVISFLKRIQVALELNDACVVIALILIERLSLTSGRASVLHIRTWRRSLLMALVVASKSVYDEKILLTDYTKMLGPHMALSLKALQQQERCFLHMLNFSTVVYRQQYAQYYYALLDVADAVAREAAASH